MHGENVGMMEYKKTSSSCECMKRSKYDHGQTNAYIKHTRQIREGERERENTMIIIMQQPLRR